MKHLKQDLTWIIPIAVVVAIMIYTAVVNPVILTP